MPEGIRVSSFDVGFQNVHVTVCGNCAESLQYCQRMFVHLLADESIDRSRVASFEVERTDSDYLLSDEHGAVVAKTQDLQELQQILKSEVTLELIRALPQFLWLHASGAALND